MENLDLTKILKDCPKGTEFYSPIYGTVKFIRIDEDENPIAIKWFDKNNNAYIEYLTKEGTFRGLGECVLFPSKGQRDWSKWQKPFVEGDIVTTNGGGQIFILKNKLNKRFIYTDSYDGICFIGYDFYSRTIYKEGLWYFDRLATEEEKQRLFNALKENDYEWDAEKKELKKIEPKFDINILQPFDKVLGRNSNTSYWVVSFFGCIKKGSNYKFICSDNIYYKQCVPYN